MSKSKKSKEDKVDGRDCTGPNCPVCALIEKAQNELAEEED